MILDRNLLLAEALAVSAAAGTVLRGDQVDLGLGQRNAFRGPRPIWLVLTVTTAFVGATATVDFIIASEATAAITGSSPVSWRSGPLTVASLTLNRRFIVPLPWDPDPLRFVGLLVTTAVATTTAGSVTAELSAFPPSDWISHPDAVN